MLFNTRLLLSCLAISATAIACAKSERETPPSNLDSSSSSGAGGTSASNTQTGTASNSAASTTGNFTTSGSGGSAGETSTTTTSSTPSSSVATSAGGTGGTAPVIEDPCGTNGGSAGGGGAPMSGDEVFVEDFESGADRWENSEGTVWSVTTDSETSSDVYGNGEVINQPRVASVINACFTDIIVEANVKVLDFPGSSTTYYAGPCLRVESAEDYYILGIQGNGNVGLIRVSNGSRSSLQSDGSAIPDGQLEDTWYTLRLEAVGDSLKGYVNDTLILEDTDSTNTFGSIGVCTSNASAVFDDITATLP